MANYTFPYDEAPDDAEYVLAEANDNLPNSKVAVPGPGISIVVGDDDITISNTGGGPIDASYITANDETVDLPNSFQITEGTGISVDFIGNQVIISATSTGGGGSGTVLSVASQNATPLFTTNVSNPTTTANITYTLTSAASGTFFAGPASGGPSGGTYRVIVGSDVLSALEAGSNITIIPQPNGKLQISVSGPISASLIANGSVSDTEFQYLDGVTSAIQTQLNNKQPLDATLTAWSGFNSDGILVQSAPDTFEAREIEGTPNEIVVSDGDGVGANPVIGLDSGIDPALLADGSVSAVEFQYLNSVTSDIQGQLNNKQPLDATLTALAAFSSDGFMAHTGVDTFTARAMQGTTGEINISQANGVAGNPVFSLDSSVYTERDSTLLNQLGSSTPALGQIPMGNTNGSYTLTKPNAGTGIQMDYSNGVFTVSATGAQGGTITSAGDLSPLFTTVETSGNISFTATNAASGTYYGVAKNGAPTTPSFLTLIPAAISENNINCGLFIDGASAVISSGEVGVLNVDFDGLVVGWTVLNLQSATTVLNVYKSSYANFPSMTSMVGAGTKPGTSSAFKNKGGTSNWGTTAISNGDVLKFALESNDLSQGIAISLKILRTS